PVTVPELIKDNSANWARAEPATEQALQIMLGQIGLNLPIDYLDFLRCSNGGEGELPIPPYWFQIWAAEAVAEANRVYNVTTNLPSYFAFGSSGGGELFLFDTRREPVRRVYTVPIIPMDENLTIEITPDFQSFVACMGRKLDK
ncbi:MAG: SMI1/KNR4 family protein, partial [Anaerolineae bacterium]